MIAALESMPGMTEFKQEFADSVQIEQMLASIKKD